MAILYRLTTKDGMNGIILDGFIFSMRLMRGCRYQNPTKAVGKNERPNKQTGGDTALEKTAL